jgi:nitrite reductase/ring-hydroxylating ferredoxin subunit
VAPDSNLYFDLATGLLDRRVFGNQGLYEREIERVFGRCWLVLAPESWVSKPDDFITTSMGEDPVLLWRGDDGELRAFVNLCIGGQGRVTAALQDNRSVLVCPCHQWTYASDGHLAEAPHAGLMQLERLAVYKGLVFACFDPSTPSLEDYLGDFAFYLDMLLDRRDGGVEAWGNPPVRWSVDANWKLPVEAFAGDTYREAVLRARGRTIPGAPLHLTPQDGWQITAGMGSIVVASNSNLYELPEAVRAYEEANREETEHRLGPVRSETVFPIAGALFPNLVVDWMTRSIHAWQPRGLEETEVHTYCIVDRVAPLEVKEALRSATRLHYGPSGLRSLDDAGPWTEITRMSGRKSAQNDRLSLQMGLGRERFHEDLPGRVSQLQSEMNQRYFYARWQQLLDRDSWDDIEINTIFEA